MTELDDFGIAKKSKGSADALGGLTAVDMVGETAALFAPPDDSSQERVAEMMRLLAQFVGLQMECLSAPSRRRLREAARLVMMSVSISATRAVVAEMDAATRAWWVQNGQPYGAAKHLIMMADKARGRAQKPAPVESWMREPLAEASGNERYLEWLK